MRSLIPKRPRLILTRSILSILTFALSGCAILYHVQVGEIDQRAGKLEPFEMKVSETGVDLQDAVRLQRALFRTNQYANAAGDAAAVISLFQMGPHTGAPVYSATYAEKLVVALHDRCPDGLVTGVMSVRETRKYPVISGEIVKVRGYCLNVRRPASIDAKAETEVTEEFE